MANMEWRRPLSGAIVGVFLLGFPGVFLPGAAAAAFFSAVDDLPLAPGLSEAVEQGVEFDSPEGRIVMAVAIGAAGEKPGLAEVQAFYREALPPLGWRLVSGDTYWREGERLTLHVDKDGGRVTVRIRLVPAGAE